MGQFVVVAPGEHAATQLDTGPAEDSSGTGADPCQGISRRITTELSESPFERIKQPANQAASAAG